MKQPAIQRTMAKKHLQNGHLVLYDITSSCDTPADWKSAIQQVGNLRYE